MWDGIMTVLQEHQLRISLKIQKLLSPVETLSRVITGKEE